MAVLAGRNAEFFGEYAAEIPGVVKTDGVANFGNVEVGGGQEFFGFNHLIPISSTYSENFFNQLKGF